LINEVIVDLRVNGGCGDYPPHPQPLNCADAMLKLTEYTTILTKNDRITAANPDKLSVNHLVD